MKMIYCLLATSTDDEIIEKILDLELVKVSNDSQNNKVIYIDQIKVQKTLLRLLKLKLTCQELALQCSKMNISSVLFKMLLIYSSYYHLSILTI